MPDLTEFDYSAFMTYKPIIFSAADDCAFEHIKTDFLRMVFSSWSKWLNIFSDSFLTDIFIMNILFYQQVRSDFTLVAQLVAKVVF